ncbi:MAG TPA: ABC transporter ATP-binding protein, partial [Clostridia bacterium]|nr:ABC transporter ATP-binding protein [Clostridia bacterium]
MSGSFFKTAGLTVGYHGIPLIRDISVSLRQGEILTLIGPNGSGKSTILKSITRHLESISGVVYIGKNELGKMRFKDLATTLSVVLTDRIRPEMMSCYDVVASGRYPYTNSFGMLTDKDRAVIGQCLARVHAQDIADRDFTQISDGQRQRILLARAICQEPDVIVLDEPTSFLDIRHKIELLGILLEMSREKNITVILSLHEIDLASKISDVVMCVKGEHIARIGRPEEIFTEEIISDLYDLSSGSYNVVFGSVELEKPRGVPELFVLAGGGFGMHAYRTLQKKRIPFYTGILFENEVDYAVARALAGEVFAEKAFHPISKAVF